MRAGCWVSVRVVGRLWMGTGGTGGGPGPGLVLPPQFSVVVPRRAQKQRCERSFLLYLLYRVELVWAFHKWERHDYKGISLCVLLPRLGALARCAQPRAAARGAGGAFVGRKRGRLLRAPLRVRDVAFVGVPVDAVRGEH
jgi:hypothetical protein